MSSAIHKPARRRLAALGAVLAMTVAAVLATAGPAAAHAALVSTDPADGTTLGALPAQITLTFDDTIVADLGGNQVQVTDATGAALTDGDPVVQDNIVTQALTGAASGPITVAWRVVSDDGHPVSGGFSFTVTAPPTPTATRTAASTPTPEPTPTPVVTAVPAAAQASPVPWIVLGAVLIAAIGGVVYLLVSRSRRRPGGPVA